MRCAIGYPDGEWIVLNNLGELERSQLNHKRAAALLTEAIAVARRSGDAESAAMSIHGLADVALELGEVEVEVALQRYRESLALTRTLEGGDRNTCYCLAGMAAAAALQRGPIGAGRFWGALGALEDELGVRLPSAERSRYELKLAGLDEAAFAVGLLEGRRSPLDAVLGS